MTPKLNGWNNNLSPSDGVGGRKPSHETLNSKTMTQLTKEEIEMIEREAGELYPKFISGSLIIQKANLVAEQLRTAYTEAATKYLLQLKAERERAGKIREAFAEYVHTEGCSCCEDVDGHKEATRKLGELLKMEKYSDGSGYDTKLYLKHKNEKK